MACTSVCTAGATLTVVFDVSISNPINDASLAGVVIGVAIQSFSSGFTYDEALAYTIATSDAMASFTPNTFTVSSLTRTTNRVSQPTSVSLAFTLKNKIPAGSVFKFTIPKN